MRAFITLFALYAGLWAVLLLPGGWVLFRREGSRALPDDDVSDTAWVRRLEHEMLARAEPEPIAPDQVPLAEIASGRRRRAATRPRAGLPVLCVAGHLLVPSGTVLEAGVIVDGDLDCEPGAHLAGPVWCRGTVRVDQRCVADFSVVAEGDLWLGQGVKVSGGVAAVGEVWLDPDAVVEGPATSKSVIVLSAGARAASALAPLVRAVPVAAGELDVTPPSEAVPLVEPDWTEEMDEALAALWPQGRLAELVEAFADATGVVVRGVHLVRRAREVGLLPRGIPARPAVLGRKPAWVLGPERIRVGADLRVPPGGTVSYDLIVEGALEVFQEAEIEGSVHSGRGLLLRSASVVYGAAVSDGMIVCEEGSAVLGPVDSSTHVMLFANVRVGLPGFGGVHSLGLVALEPGAEVVGGVVAGLAVRGEPLRTQAPVERPAEPEPDESEGPGEPQTRRRRVRRHPDTGPAMPRVKV